MIPLLVLILFTIIGYIPLIMHTARNRKQQEQEPSPIVPMTDINADIAKTIGRFLLKTLSVCLGLAALLFGFFTVAFGMCHGGSGFCASTLDSSLYHRGILFMFVGFLFVALAFTRRGKFLLCAAGTPTLAMITYLILYESNQWY